MIGDEHLRILRCGYDRPQYLPSMYSLIKGDKWYSYTEVGELRKFRIPGPREETGKTSEPTRDSL